VFVIAFLFGIADAFFYPASTSILPSIVPRSMLREGNAVLQVTLHLGMTAGPVLAGLIIAGELNSLSHEPIGSNAESLGTGLSDAYEKDREGLARAFFVDAITFALSLISLFFVKARQLGGDQKSEREESLYREIKVAVQWVVSIPAVRLGFMGMAIIHFLFMPVIYVGLPVLAKSRFADGAYVYGLELAAYGLGALLGATLSGLLRSPSNRNLIPLMFGAFIYSGASLGLVVWYEPYWWAMLLFFFAGIFDSYMYVHFNTWIQRICPEQLLGRVMSILMFMSVGLVPVGNAVIGFALDWNLLATLVGVSATIVVICAAIALNPRARQVQADKVASPEAG
jgi:MFS family permease